MKINSQNISNEYEIINTYSELTILPQLNEFSYELYGVAESNLHLITTDFIPDSIQPLLRICSYNCTWSNRIELF